MRVAAALLTFVFLLLSGAIMLGGCDSSSETHEMIVQTVTPTARPSPIPVEIPAGRLIVMQNEELITISTGSTVPTEQVVLDIGVESAALSPDGHTIAYAQGNATVLLDLDTGGTTRLTNKEGFSSKCLSWSPSGARLLWDVYPWGGMVVRDMDAEPGLIRPIYYVQSRQYQFSGMPGISTTVVAEYDCGHWLDDSHVVFRRYSGEFPPNLKADEHLYPNTTSVINVDMHSVWNPAWEGMEAPPPEAELSPGTQSCPPSCEEATPSEKEANSVTSEPASVTEELVQYSTPVVTPQIFTTQEPSATPEASIVDIELPAVYWDSCFDGSWLLGYSPQVDADWLVTRRETIGEAEAPVSIGDNTTIRTARFIPGSCSLLLERVPSTAFPDSSEEPVLVIAQIAPGSQEDEMQWSVSEADICGGLSDTRDAGVSWTGVWIGNPREHIVVVRERCGGTWDNPRVFTTALDLDDGHMTRLMEGSWPVIGWVPVTVTD